MMNELNEIFKSKYGRDMTNEEAWKMVDVVKMILANADKNLNKELNK